MMKYILTILIMLSSFIGFSQYSIHRIYNYGENYQDTTLIKDGTDSLFRLFEGGYIFAGVIKTVAYVSSSEIANLSSILSAAVSGKQDILGFTPLNPANNLSEVTPATARSNLQLGTLATQSGTFSGTSSGDNTGDNATNTQYSGLAASKQDILVSGTNIKTINGTSILGSGNIPIAGGEAFPIGSVYISILPTNPNTLLGYGTWVAFGAGKILVGQDISDTDFDLAEETGGSKTKTITAGNLPQLSVAITDPGHIHVQNKNTATTGGLSGTTPDASTNTSAASGYSTANATTGITATANTGGANTAINVMNPYIVCYFWKRTL